MTKSRTCLCTDDSCEVEGPPGSSGILSDKSVEFFKDPLRFVQSRCDLHKTRVFVTRLALKQTLVIADHSILTNFLSQGLDDFENGVQTYFGDLFGHNIMFAGPEEARKLRNMMLPLFSRESIPNYRQILDNLLNDWFESLGEGDELTVDFYQDFKLLSLAQNLETFLGISKVDHKELFEEVHQHVRTHWQGVASVPLEFSIPFLMTGGYKKAMKSKKKLLQIIAERMEGRLNDFQDSFRSNTEDFLSPELMHNHLLLFCCNLIPKGVGAIVSMVMEMGEKWSHLLDQNGNLSEENLERVVLEVVRLFPPFSSGLKVATKDTKIGPYHIPSGASVYYNLAACMQDPAKFLEPGEFIPGRWAGVSGGGRETLNLLFSTGPHDCIGRHFTWSCVKTVLSFILQHFSIAFPSLPESGAPEVKQIPVLRPAMPHRFNLRKKNTLDISDDVSTLSISR